MKLLYLCLKHYDLASTTVTGIPMKEEQNASRQIHKISVSLFLFNIVGELLLMYSMMSELI